MVEREAAAAKISKKVLKVATEDEGILYEAARRQGMNTDVRRSVFVILMTSEVSLNRCTAEIVPTHR